MKTGRAVPQRTCRLSAVLMLVSAILLTAFAFPLPVRAGNAVVVACSDYQYPNWDAYGLGGTGNQGGSIVVGRIAQRLREAGFSGVDGLLSAGDYDFDLNRTAGDTADGISSLKGALNASGLTDGGTRWVLVQGNHDPADAGGGTSKTGKNDPPSGAYGVYVLNERDYPWHGGEEAGVKEAAEALRAYLNGKLKEKFTAPIFVISHLPLHYTMRTWYEGDARYARYIFDVLNGFSAHGLNIIYLYGHDHSQGWDDYLGGSKVFLAPGKQIRIADGTKTGYTTQKLKFVYMNAGFTGYYNNHNLLSTPSESPVYNIDDLSMSCFVISGRSVVIRRFSAGGSTVLKKAGVPNRYRQEDSLQGYSPDTEVVSGSYRRTGGAVTWHKAASSGGEESGGSEAGQTDLKTCSVCGTLFVPEKPKKVTGIKLNQTTARMLTASSVPLPGCDVSKLQLKATVSPADAGNKSVKWTTSDKKIAVVDARGRVRGLKAGTVTITATTVDGGKKATCRIQVLSRKALALKTGSTYVIRSGLNGRFSMDVMYANFAKNTNVSLFGTDTGRASQKLTVQRKKVKGKYWYLLTRKNSRSGRRAVTEKGRNLVFAVSKWTDSQLFRAYQFSDGTVQFISRGTNRAIAVAGGSAGSRVNIAPAKADLGDGQRWRCTIVGSAG